MGNNTGAVEHVLAGTGGEAHLLLSGTRVLFGAVLSGKLALWTACVWRNVAEVGRCEGRYKGTLSETTLCVIHPSIAREKCRATNNFSHFQLIR